MVRRWLGRDIPGPAEVDPSDAEERIRAAHRLTEQQRRLIALDRRVDVERGRGERR